MIIFWVLAAGLTGLALLFVVPPLVQARSADDAPSQDALNLALFRDRLAELDGDRAAGVLDHTRYAAARRDLERELLHDLHDGAPVADAAAPAPPRGSPARAPVLALVLALVVPAAAVLGYLRLGDPGMIPRLEAPDGAAPVAADGAQAAASLQALAQGLAQRLERTPDNLDGWLMLGRTWFALGQPDQALKALERAYRLAPEQPDVLVAYAEALAVNAGNDLSGQPAELIQTALQQDPEHQGARWLAGTLAYQQGRFAQAAETWQPLLGTLDPAGEDARQLGDLIAAARAKAGTARPDTLAAGPDGTRPAPAGDAAPAAATAATGDAPAAPAAGGARLTVSVSLAPALAAQAAPQDTVFVFARTPEGPPMPLAVRRIKVADLPATLTLDDSAALIPSLRLSSAAEVMVGARVSKRGEATPESGDLEGETGPVKVSGAEPVAVTLDRVRP